MRINRKIFNTALMVIVLLIGAWFLKDFNLSWVQADGSGAKITINFLFPMKQDKFSDKISIHTPLPYANAFDCKLYWKTNHTVVIELREKSEIRGQKVVMQIQHALTKYSMIKKNARVSVQFQAPVEILQPKEEQLIATQNAFYIKFSTPMKKSVLNKYLESDGEFYIEPVKINTSEDHIIVDNTYFEFKPKKPLENGRKYILSFRKGMPSQAGILLEKDINIVLNTDKKPKIIQTYPKMNSKWIGFYPKFLVETDKPIKVATLQLGNLSVKGKLRGEYGAEFLLPELLKSNTPYTVEFSVQADSGEISEVQTITFTTAPINKDTHWVEIILKNEALLKVYQGEKVIKIMDCSGGTTKEPTPLGTYYTQDKGEKFFSHKFNEGANYWIRVTEDILLQGMTRDEYWNIKHDIRKNLGMPISHGNIILNEEDAKWLYQHLPTETMIVIHT